jgi:hypothetical protein
MNDIVDNIYSELVSDMERRPCYPADTASRLEEISTSISMLARIYAAANNSGIVDYDGVFRVTVRLARLLYARSLDNEVTQEHNDETIVIME